MTIGSITSNFFIKSLSALANNSDSIVPMATKDLIADFAIVDTYRKEGGKDDVFEKGLESFGTSCIWLFGIPVIKSIFDKTVYKFMGLSKDLDLRVIDNKEKLNNAIEALNNAKNKSEIIETQKNILNSLDKKTILKYKGAFYGKFAFATAACAIALAKLIQYKKKVTERRIEKDYYKNNASKILLNQSVKQNEQYKTFTGKKNKQITFGSNMLGIVQNAAKNIATIFFAVNHTLFITNHLSNIAT